MQNTSSLHTHTCFSIRDGGTTVKNLVSRAKELGFTSLAQTEHGYIYGWDDFKNECESQGIKPIFGVEAYIKGNLSGLREHVIFLAMNENGLKQIQKFATKANEHLEGGKKKYPVATEEMVHSIFKKNDVVCLSGCVQGVLASILLINESKEKAISKLKKEQKKFISPQDPNYQSVVKEFEEKEKEVAIKTAEKEETMKVAKFPYKGLMKKAMASGDNALILSVEAKKAMAQEAEDKLPFIKEELAALKKERTAIRQKKKKMDEKIIKWEEKREQIEKIKSSFLEEQEVAKKVLEKINAYKKTFGANFYIEIQYHGLESEAYVFPKLVTFANQTNTEIVATNDVHITNNSEEEVLGRSIMSSLVFEQYKPATDVDRELYLKTNDELASWLLKILDPETVNRAIRNIGVIADKCNVTFTKENHYPVFRDRKGNIQDAKQWLWDACIKGKNKLFTKETWTKEYEDRLNYEFGVIETMGFLDYLCIVLDFIQEGDRIAKDNPYQVGLGVGFGRGSAAGSLVCYLSGITKLVDPIKYNLLFERFLNTERVSMPDIDTDFAEALRDDVIEYVTKVYGKNAVCSIGTMSYLYGKSAIRTSARVYGWSKHPNVIDGKNKEEKEEQKKIKKEINTKYLSIANKMCKSINDDSDNWYDILYPTANEDEKKILDGAKTIEGMIDHTSVHAAGIIISDNDDVSDYVALYKEKENDVWKAQCDAIRAEAKGLLKMDFLGLKTLDIITNTFINIKKHHGISLTIYDIPFEKEVFQNIFAKGLTNGIFQFESDGMKATAKKFNPTCIEDIILLNAVYRPGPMQYIPNIIDSKNGVLKPKYLIDGMEEILAPTYGYPVYQEQIMQLFQLAGFSLGQADIIRRYMSKKKTEKFMEYQYSKDGHVGFVDGFVQKGAKEENALELWNQLLDFAKYAFNKSHAAVYAVLAYITAWLKYHYPAEYIAGYLSVKPEDISKLMEDAKILGVTIKVPNINQSEFKYVVDGNVVYCGFAGIKGFAQEETLTPIIKEREKNGYYVSFADFIHRVDKINASTVEKLIRSGCFDEMNTRASLLYVYKDFLEAKANIQKAEEELKKAETEKEKERILNVLELEQNSFNEMQIPNLTDDKEANLIEEYDYLSTFISAHPLDFYTNTTKTTLKKAMGKTTVFAYISNIKEYRDKNGNLMCFAKAIDNNTSIDVVIFSQAYESIRPLHPGVYLIKGKISEKYDDFQDDIVKSIIVDEITKAKKKDRHIAIYTERKLIDIPELKKYFTEPHLGHQAIVINPYAADRYVIPTKYYLSDAILKDDNFKTALL